MLYFFLAYSSHSITEEMSAISVCVNILHIALGDNLWISAYVAPLTGTGSCLGLKIIGLRSAEWQVSRTCGSVPVVGSIRNLGTEKTLSQGLRELSGSISSSFNYKGPLHLGNNPVWKPHINSSWQLPYKSQALHCQALPNNNTQRNKFF